MPHRMFPQLSLGRDRIALKSYCVSHCQRAMINAIQANMKLLKTSFRQYSLVIATLLVLPLTP
jgi:hypothetical protein